MRTLVSRGLAVIVLIAAMAGLVQALQSGSASADDQPPTRTQVLERARAWLGRSDIPYSMSTCYTTDGASAGCGQPDTYRADCSGFVSLAWGADNLTVGSTRPALTPLGGNPSKSHEISKQDLRPADALAFFRGPGADAHIALFIRWKNEPGGAAVVWEQAGGAAGPREQVWSQDAQAAYRAFRYTGIRDDDTSDGGSSNTAAPAAPSDTHWVTTFKDAPGRREPSRDAARVVTLRAGRNPVRCATTGGTVTGPEGTNNRWLLVDLNEGAQQGWVSAYYLKNWGEDQARADDGTDLPECQNRATGTGGGNQSPDVKTDSRPTPAAGSHAHNHYVYFDDALGGNRLSPAVKDASHADLAPVVSWNYRNPATNVTTNSVLWWGKPHASNHIYKRLHAAHSGKCLGTHGHHVIQYTCNDNDDHYWAVADEADGTGKLKNLATEQCMHLGRNNGDAVVLGPCEGTRSRLIVTTTGRDLNTLPADTYQRELVHDGPATAAAGQRAAAVAQRELEKEQAGNKHAGAFGCNFYSGQMNGSNTRCIAAGHSGWGRGNWCADFVRYSWDRAGQIIMSGLDRRAESFKEYGQWNLTWHPADSGYVPQPGDAVVYRDSDSNDLADHVAIVHERTDKGEVHVISGNANPGVVRRTVLDWDKIQGFTTPDIN